MVATSILASLSLAFAGSAAAQSPIGEPAKRSVEADLAKAFNEVWAHLAVGTANEQRRIPTDNSSTRRETPYGPILIRGMAVGATNDAKSWIGRMVREEMGPPADAVFKAYRACKEDEYDTVTVEYKIGPNRVRIWQAVWVFAITIEGPETAYDLGDKDAAALADWARGLVKKLLKGGADTAFDAPQRHVTCVSVRKAVPSREHAPGAQFKDPHHPTSQEVRAILGESKNVGPCWSLMGWWADGRRFGVVGIKHPGSHTAAVVGVDPVLNRAWFRRGPKSNTGMRRRAAEYRASLASPEQK